MMRFCAMRLKPGDRIRLAKDGAVSEYIWTIQKRDPNHNGVGDRFYFRVTSQHGAHDVPLYISRDEGWGYVLEGEFL